MPSARTPQTPPSLKVVSDFIPASITPLSPLSPTGGRIIKVCILFVLRPIIISVLVTPVCHFIKTDDKLNLHRHDLAVAHRGLGVVCYSVTYLEYQSACRAVYASPLSHISDIRELPMEFLKCDRELYFKSPINIHGKLDAPSLIKYKVTPSGLMQNLQRKQLIRFYCVALIL